MTSTPALNPRQQRFVEEYLKDLNATQACLRAGYTGRKPGQAAHEMFASPKVRAAIETAQRRAARDAEVDAERVLAGYKAIAFASVGDFIAFRPDGSLHVGRSTIDPARMTTLDDLSVTRFRTAPARKGGERVRRIRIRLASKLDALKALARHLGLFTTRRARPWPVAEAGLEPEAGFAGTISTRRARFVAAYLKCGNGREAYVRAGYVASSRAGAHASRLMSEPAVRAAIAAGRRRLAARLDLDAARVIAEYAKVGFATMRNYVEVQPDGSARVNLAKAPRDTLAALREIVIEEYVDRPPDDPRRVRRAHLKLVPRLGALEALERHLGLSDPTAWLAEDLREARERHRG